MNKKCEIAVIGAGAVGVCCALWLRRKGHDVVLVDRGDIGAGTSFGNASTIADYACTPVPHPGMWRDAVGLLFGVETPLSIKWTRLPALLPWLVGFFGHCNNQSYRGNAAVLAGLLRQAYDGYEPLLAENAQANALLYRRGCIYSYATDTAFQRAGGEISLRRELGIDQVVLGASELWELEPAMQDRVVGGVLFPTASHLSNPQSFIQALAAPLVGGDRYLRMGVSAIAGSPAGLTLTSAAGETVRAERVVIAAGPWSASLAAQCGDRVPLGAERGYHVEFQLDDDLLARPTCLVEQGFYMTPLQDHRLRAAGTIELSGLHLPLNTQRTAYIEKHIRRVLGIKAPVSSRWLGVRPTFPDYLPVIGPSSTDSRVLYAFGHQHLGMTLAGVTGRLIADLVGGRQPENGEAFSVRRFR